MRLEDLKAGMIIRICKGYYNGMYSDIKVKILEDYDDIEWEDEDGEEIEEPWHCEYMENKRDDDGEIVIVAGGTDYFHIDEKYRGKPGFILCYTKTNKPEWF